jgi:phosphotransferase system enzyme I (PtsI)
MFPLITSVEEVRRIKELIGEVKEELRARNIPFDEHMHVGVMIETPAAALISGDLAKEVDFFSIGTNDLTQYTLAIDRQNSKLETFYNPHHKAVIELIRMTAESARRAGIPCEICGELSSDMSLTEEFIRMGINGLSVPPAAVLKMREKIRGLDLSENINY